jgi:hypothetical protein
MSILQRFKLRPLTWFGLLAVAGALLYANWMVAESTYWVSLSRSYGWPFHYRTEVIKGGVTGNPTTVIYHLLAVGIDATVAIALLGGTLLALEQSRRDARHWQFSLASLFVLTTIAAIVLWLDRTRVAWYFSSHAQFWSRLDLRVNQWRDIEGTHSTFTPPWFVRAIIHAAILATLWQLLQFATSLTRRIVHGIRKTHPDSSANRANSPHTALTSTSHAQLHDERTVQQE